MIEVFFEEELELLDKLYVVLLLYDVFKGIFFWCVNVIVIYL